MRNPGRQDIGGMLVRGETKLRDPLLCTIPMRARRVMMIPQLLWITLFIPCRATLDRLRHRPLHRIAQMMSIEVDRPAPRDMVGHDPCELGTVCDLIHCSLASLPLPPFLFEKFFASRKTMQHAGNR